MASSGHQDKHARAHEEALEEFNRTWRQDQRRAAVGIAAFLALAAPAVRPATSVEAEEPLWPVEMTVDTPAHADPVLRLPNGGMAFIHQPEPVGLNRDEWPVGLAISGMSLEPRQAKSPSGGEAASSKDAPKDFQGAIEYLLGGSIAAIVLGAFLQGLAKAIEEDSEAAGQATERWIVSRLKNLFRLAHEHHPSTANESTPSPSTSDPGPDVRDALLDQQAYINAQAQAVADLGKGQTLWLGDSARMATDVAAVQRGVEAALCEHGYPQNLAAALAAQTALNGMNVVRELAA